MANTDKKIFDKIQRKIADTDKKYYEGQAELLQFQQEWTDAQIRELRQQEQGLYKERNESEKRIAELRKQHNQDLNKLRESFRQLAAEVKQNDELRTFEDRNQFSRESDQALIRLAKQIKPMVVEGKHIAILGSTSRGKSTMINSLLGKQVAQVGIGETTNESEPYQGLNFILWDTPGCNDETNFNAESMSLWKSMKYRLIIIESTIKENSRMMKMFDQIDLNYDIIVNKFDLIDEDEKATFQTQIRKEAKTLGLTRLTSIFFLSAKYPAQFGDWIELVQYLTSNVR